LLSNTYPSCQLRRSTDRCGPVREIPRTKFYVLQSVKADAAATSRHSTYEKFSHGTRVVYVCETGYHQFGSSIVECIKGEWSGRGPVCLRHRGCRTLPPSILNAEFGIYPGEAVAVTVDEDDSNVVASEESQAFYFCQNGFQMSDVNATSLLCTDGEWVGKRPICGTGHPCF
jgi:Sushi repeat (SCR repeat)